MEMQTGGARRHWLFDPSEAHTIPQIARKLIHHDEYFADEPKKDDALTYVLEYVLDQLPQEEADAVRILNIQGSTLRAAGRELGVDHKTVKARAARGVQLMRRHMVNHPWILDILEGRVPADELPRNKLEVRQRFTDLVKGSGDE
jgi:DNA-directed RNA polymerase specialized sigma24 family protein